MGVRGHVKCCAEDGPKEEVKCESDAERKVVKND